MTDNCAVLRRKNEDTWPLFCLMCTIFAVFFFCFVEQWAHAHDQYGILKDKNAIYYLTVSILPVTDFFVHEDERIKLPYGLAVVDNMSARGLSFLISEKQWKKEMDNQYTFIDQQGSSRIWFDSKSKKYLFITHVRRGLIDFWIYSAKGANFMETTLSQ